MYRYLLCVSILLAAASSAISSNASENPYIVIDSDTGNILAEHNSNDRWYPASLTKLMTAYVTFRAIRDGEISPGSPVTISQASTRQPPSRMGYKKGVTLRVDTALKIIIIKSANDVSHALAEAVAGSVPDFVARMNNQASRLDMINTRFANSNGLHSKFQFTSARDMALLSKRILEEFPEFAYMFKAIGIKTPSRVHYSYNLLLERFPGTTGMKTGFVCASGYNMVASARHSGRNIIAVVLGRSSQTDRAVSAAKLITENSAKQGTVNVSQTANTGAAPKNMRPILCTEQARASRYDPAGGQAVIKSEYLNPREPLAEILNVNIGGIDGQPSDAWVTRNLVVKGKPPVPVKRPNYDPTLGRIILSALGNPESGSIPVPTPSPR